MQREDPVEITSVGLRKLRVKHDKPYLAARPAGGNEALTATTAHQFLRDVEEDILREQAEIRRSRP